MSWAGKPLLRHTSSRRTDVHGVAGVGTAIPQGVAQRQHGHGSDPEPRHVDDGHEWKEEARNAAVEESHQPLWPATQPARPTTGTVRAHLIEITLLRCQRCNKPPGSAVPSP